VGVQETCFIPSSDWNPAMDAQGTANPSRINPTGLSPNFGFNFSVGHGFVMLQ
jgi:hypothetical protein